MVDHMPKTPMDRLASKKANVRRVYIAMDSEIADTYVEAKDAFELDKLRVQSRPGEPELLRELDASTEAFRKAEADLRANAVEFVFRGIGRKKFDELIDKYPLSDDQRKKVLEMGGDPRNVPFNSETFPPILTAASMKEPEMTAAQVRALWDAPEWNTSELMDLFNAALGANNTHRTVELGKGSSGTTSS